jgi:hypothetical protein
MNTDAADAIDEVDSEPDLSSATGTSNFVEVLLAEPSTATWHWVTQTVSF